MDSVHGAKPAPAKMRYFLADLLLDLSVRGTVLSVEVEDPVTYLVTLRRADRGVTLHHLSAWEMSRGLRGDPDALALLRAGLLADVPATP